MDITIRQEIARLRAEASRLDWQTRNPRACPREAVEAAARLKAVNDRLADLLVKEMEAAP